MAPGRLAAVVAGVDASLMVTVLGIMYALIAYSALGTGTLRFSLAATVVALLVGGLATTLSSRDLSTICGPTAIGALVIDVFEAEGLGHLRRDSFIVISH